MHKPYFIISTYDAISAEIIGQWLNANLDKQCHIGHSDQFSASYNLSHDSIDNLIAKHTQLNIAGCINVCSAYELHHKTLIEKTKTPCIKINLAIEPKLRISFLLSSWIKAAGSIDAALDFINKQICNLKAQPKHTYNLYRFDYFINHIKSRAPNYIANKTSTTELFLYALSTVIAHDSADLLVPIKQVCFEKILKDSNFQINCLNSLGNVLTPTPVDFQKTLDASLTYRNHFNESWYEQLLNEYLNIRLQTVYYPHIDKSLGMLYAAVGYKNYAKDSYQPTVSKLISIQLNSNRPAQLVEYFNNIEETADHPEKIEVLVNIDDDDLSMKRLLDEEIHLRKFTIKYIKSPRPKSFTELWKPINALLKITDPNAYFLLNISDEMLFATKGWDSNLEKYIGFFPDHIFRLRASRNKFRNYFDRWECSFAQDSIPITTKRWIDIGGDWNPCFGPDSFQQLIAFYLAKEGQFSGVNYLREAPLLDIKFHGDVPGLGIDNEKSWKHVNDHLNAMQICQSYKMQLEAKRRAILLKLTIVATQNQIEHYEIIDLKWKRKLKLLNKDNPAVSTECSYKISWLAITLTNQWRKLYMHYYFGGGQDDKRFILKYYAAYLKAKHRSVYFIYLIVNKFKYKVFRLTHKIACKMIRIAKSIAGKKGNSKVLIGKSN